MPKPKKIYYFICSECGERKPMSEETPVRSGRCLDCQKKLNPDGDIHA